MKKIIIGLALLSVVLLMGCTTLAEESCERLDGRLTDKYDCEIGEENSTYKYSFICGKDIITLYSNDDIDINFNWQLKFRCSYVKLKKG